MKSRVVIFFLFLLLGSNSLFAQRFVYVDSDYILEQMSEYKAAQKELNETVDAWQKEIAQRQKKIEKKYNAFQSEQVLLTERMKRERMDIIEEMEEQLQDFQQNKFGPNGLLFSKRQELIKPIQDKIYKAIKKMALDKGYDIVFDKASGVPMLYTNSRLDKSGLILEMMGY